MELPAIPVARWFRECRWRAFISSEEGHVLGIDMPGGDPEGDVTMPAKGMSGLIDVRRGLRLLPTERTARRSFLELKKSRGNPGPIALAGFGHVCRMFVHVELVVGDLEGKSTCGRSKMPRVPCCKHMPTSLGRASRWYGLDGRYCSMEIASL